MTRLCERPGCSEPGTVAYRADAGQRSVTLGLETDAELARAGVLCRRHADAMVVPLGWTLDDRREPVPRLFKVTSPTEPRRRRSRAARPQGEDHTAPLPIFATEAAEAGGPVEPPEPEPVAVAEPATVAELAGEQPPDAPDETRAIPWNPHFDTDDDLDGLLSAETPLLARAFGNSRRRPRRR